MKTEVLYLSPFTRKMNVVKSTFHMVIGIFIGRCYDIPKRLHNVYSRFYNRPVDYQHIIYKTILFYYFSCAKLLFWTTVQR